MRTIAAATHSQSLFARLHWQPDFLGRRLVAGAGRYTKESKDAERSIVVNGSDVFEADGLSHISYNRTNPEFTATWHWSDALSTYVKAATAFSRWRARTAPSGDFAANTYRPESFDNLRGRFECHVLNSEAQYKHQCLRQPAQGRASCPAGGLRRG